MLLDRTETNCMYLHVALSDLGHAVTAFFLSSVFKTIHIIVLRNLKPRFNVNHNQKTICHSMLKFLKVMGKEGVSLGRESGELF